MDFIDEQGRYHQYKKLCPCSHAPHCDLKCDHEGCNCTKCQCI